MRGACRLIDRLASELKLHNALFKSFDLIGDIVVLKSPLGSKELSEKKDALKVLAELLLRELPYVKTVLLAITPVEGEYRLRKLVFLAGEEKTRTLYKEHGCSFLVDVAKVYISPRLSFEHARIAKLIRPNETIVNMFAGVGTFSIVVAKHSKARVIYSIDKNPEAYKLMVYNIKLNRVEDRVVALLGDCRDVIRNGLVAIADRVLMPLPSFSKSFYEHALLSMKNEGVIHSYEFVKVDRGKGRKEAPKLAFKIVSEILSEIGANFELEGGRVVRSVGPREYQVALDIKVYKQGVN
uniref:Class I SAM-dependent methyltransferase family protein n=1 Tax=Fervidicoccus fontis TaxID=683846 RepID=A0A7J3ZK78_9CREN